MLVGHIRVPELLANKVCSCSGKRGLFATTVVKAGRASVAWISRKKDTDDKAYFRSASAEASSRGVSLAFRQGGQADIGLIGVDPQKEQAQKEGLGNFLLLLNIGTNSPETHTDSVLSAAVRVRYVRSLTRRFVDLFEIEHPWSANLNLVALGVHCPLSGLRLAMSPSTLKKVDGFLQAYTTRRPIRRVGDLARPF